MNLIPVQPLPNQSFSVTLNGARFDIAIHETNGVMSATIVNNGVTLIENSRITAGTFLLPYFYEEDGNFLFFNINDEIIYYPNFGVTQQLAYFTPDDLAYLRGTNVS